MAKRLWEFDDEGEPWLENMPLLIVNRKKVHKKGKKKMARRRKRTNRRHTRRVHRRNVRHAPRRRRRTRRNPWPMAGTVAAINPRRRRRGRRNAARRRHRRGRRNPAVLGLALPPIKIVAYTGLGFIGTPVLEGFLNGVLPVSLTSTTLGKYASKIASVLGLTFISKMVLGRAASMYVGVGGGVYVLTSAVREFLPTLLPAGTLSAYAVPSRNFLQRSSMQSYMKPTSRTFNTLGAANYGAFNTPNSAPNGGMNLVAQRFRRFN